MSNISNWDLVGKFVSSPKEEAVYYRFLNSDKVTFKRPESNLGEVLEFTPNAIVLKGDSEGNYFVVDSKDLRFTNEPVSNYNLIGWIAEKTKSATENTTVAVQKNIGFLGDGFTQSIDDLRNDILGTLKKALLISVPLAILILIFNLTRK